MRLKRPALVMASTGFCALGLVLGAFCVAAAHRRFALGVWQDAEGVDLLLHGAAGLCLFGLAGQSFVSGDRLAALVRHPALIIALALAGWSLVSSAFAAFPLGSLLGPPQNALGALWHIAFVAFLASGLVLRQQPWVFAGLVAVAAAAGLLAFGFNLRQASWFRAGSFSIPGLPVSSLLTFNEYLGFYALPLLAFSGLALQAGRRWKKAGWVFFLLALALLAISNNRTAGIAATLGAALFLCFRPGAAGARLWRHIMADRRRAVGIVLACVAALAAAPFILLLLLQANSIPSLESRRVLYAVLEPSLFDSVRSVLVGHGWGQYQSTLLRNLPSAGISLVQSEWIDIGRDEFHSHHAWLEALFALGLPGLLLMATLPCAIMLGSRPALRPLAFGLVLALGLVETMWFAMPETLAILALAVAALAPPPRAAAGDPETAVRPRAWSWAIAVPAFALAIAAIGFSAWEWRYATAMSEMKSCLARPGNRPECAQLSVPRDPRGDGLGLAALITESLAGMTPKEGAVRWPRRRVALLGSVLMQAANRCAERCSLPLSFAIANAYAALATNPASLPAGEIFMPEIWRQELQRAILSAPSRFDIAAPYLNWLLHVGNIPALQAFLAESDKASPHPVWQWYSGIALLDAPDAASRQRGLALMRQAMAEGAERFMPIDSELKRQLGIGGG